MLATGSGLALWTLSLLTPGGTPGRPNFFQHLLQRKLQIGGLGGFPQLLFLKYRNDFLNFEGLSELPLRRFRCGSAIATTVLTTGSGLAL